ncbi:unnamed protein product [Closterium sp. Yama58-4]|nr:unnamed protein product [Closterium sp. Yama58-4]
METMKPSASHSRTTMSSSSGTSTHIIIIILAPLPQALAGIGACVMETIKPSASHSRTTIAISHRHITSPYHIAITSPYHIVMASSKPPGPTAAHGSQAGKGTYVMETMKPSASHSRTTWVLYVSAQSPPLTMSISHTLDSSLRGGTAGKWKGERADS